MNGEKKILIVLNLSTRSCIVPGLFLLLGSREVNLSKSGKIWVEVQKCWHSACDWIAHVFHQKDPTWTTATCIPLITVYMYSTYPLGLASSSFNTVRSQYSNTMWILCFLLNTSNRLTRLLCLRVYRHQKIKLLDHTFSSYTCSNRAAGI